ncbi:MAG: hypothetical protein AB1668_06025 [Nanoarchaeota archaeon]
MVEEHIHLERNLVVNNKEINYRGIFSADELFSVVNKALAEKGYTKKEKKSEELVTPAGRMLFLELRPFKVVTHYITLMIKIRITLDNVTEAVEEIRGERKAFQRGDVNVAFDAWSLTDYEHRWGMKPWLYFVKGVVNKFLYSWPIESGSISTLLSDTAHIYAQVKKLLNSYRKEEIRPLSEEEIKKEIEEEIKKGNAAGKKG